MPMDVTRALRGLFVASSVCALGACSEPLQNGGVVVFGGASARFDAMCRFRRSAESGQSSCVSPEGDAPRATASLIKSKTQLLKGPRAEGSVGDVLLTNGEIAMVFGGQGSAKPGVLLDVVDTHVGQDELGSFATCVGDGAGCLTSIGSEFGQEQDGSAWYEVRYGGLELFDARTRYTLLPGARSLLVTTIVSTQSIVPLPVPRLGDLVTWGSSQSLVPAGENPPLVAAVGKDVAYGIVPVDERPSAAVDTLEGAMFLRYAQDVAVSATRTIRRDRAFVVAPRGDTLGVLTEVALSRDGQAPGAIDVKFVGADGAPMAAPVGGHVRVLGPTFPIDGYFTIVSSPDGALAAAEAPPGKYEIDFEGAGRQAAAKMPVEVRSGEVTSVTLTITESGLSPQTK